MQGLAIDLSGKVCLVTGATAGIGRAIAVAMAQCGAAVVASGRDGERGRQLVDELGGRGLTCRFAPADLRDPTNSDMLVRQAEQWCGGVDILVNNAGIVRRGAVDKCTDEDFRETMEVNVFSVFRTSRAAVRSMKATGGGVILNIASDWGLVGGRDALAYCASKGAVVQMTRAMAIDHARDAIRVNALCPGDTDTAMLDNSIPPGLDRVSGLAQLGAAIPLGRVAQPNDIASAAVFLASDHARHVTGIMFPIDGGVTAG
jgi:NAD(P)-dependent dehydrogenase (short-subunit alcohol dehydrogenase family)